MCVNKCYVNNHVNISDLLAYGFHTEELKVKAQRLSTMSIQMVEVAFHTLYWNLALRLSMDVDEEGKGSDLVPIPNVDSLPVGILELRSSNHYLLLNVSAFTISHFL